MKDDLNFKQIVSEAGKQVVSAFDGRFDEILARLDEFGDTLNETLEAMSERQYDREPNDLFE